MFNSFQLHVTGIFIWVTLSLLTVHNSLQNISRGKGFPSVSFLASLNLNGPLSQHYFTLLSSGFPFFPLVVPPRLQIKLLHSDRGQSKVSAKGLSQKYSETLGWVLTTKHFLSFYLMAFTSEIKLIMWSWSSSPHLSDLAVKQWKNQKFPHPTSFTASAKYNVWGFCLWWAP